MIVGCQMIAYVSAAIIYYLLLCTILPGLFCNDLKTKEGKQAGRKTSIDVLVDQYRIIICFSYEIEGSSIQKM